MIRDSGEEIPEIGFRVECVELCSPISDRIAAARSPALSDTANSQSFATERNEPDRLFGLSLRARTDAHIRVWLGNVQLTPIRDISKGS